MLIGAVIAIVSLLYGMRLGRLGVKAEVETVAELVSQPIVKRKAYTVGGKRAPKVQDDNRAYEAEKRELRASE